MAFNRRGSGRTGMGAGNGAGKHGKARLAFDSLVGCDPWWRDLLSPETLARIEELEAKAKAGTVSL